MNDKTKQVLKRFLRALFVLILERLLNEVTGSNLSMSAFVILPALGKYLRTKVGVNYVPF